MAVSSDADRSASKAIPFRGTLSWVWTVFGPFLGLVLITVLFGMLNRRAGTFLTIDNWRTIAVQTVIVGTAALGMTIIMIAGGIDLSAGSTVALVTVCIALFVKKVDPVLPDSTACAQARPAGCPTCSGIVIGGVCGAINGALIAGLRVVPFIVTLGSYTVYRGLATWLASSTTVYVPADAKAWWLSRILKTEPEPSWLLLAPGVWVLLVLSVLVALILRYSLLGRYVYAIGSNEATARLCGINVPLVKVIVYTLGGLAMGLCRGLSVCLSGRDRRPHQRRRSRAAGDRRRRDRRRQLERRRGNRAGYLDRLLDHVGAEERLCSRRHSQFQPGHHHRYHHRRRGHA